jgi:5'-3' exonuclease
MQDERRAAPNEAVADAVDATVELIPHISRRQAALVMARDGVPLKVIRRVLDQPLLRRTRTARRAEAATEATTEAATEAATEASLDPTQLDNAPDSAG